jgi:hypothetical protein
MHSDALLLDNRILSFALHDSLVSIWTLEGRQAIPFVCGDRLRGLLAHRCGQTDSAQPSVILASPPKAFASASIALAVGDAAVSSPETEVRAHCAGASGDVYRAGLLWVRPRVPRKSQTKVALNTEAPPMDGWANVHRQGANRFSAEPLLTLRPKERFFKIRHL